MSFTLVTQKCELIPDTTVLSYPHYFAQALSSAWTVLIHSLFGNFHFKTQLNITS